MEVKIVLCQMCNGEIKNRPGIKKYCSKCRIVKDREFSLAAAEKKKLITKLVGDKRFSSKIGEGLLP